MRDAYNDVSNVLALETANGVDNVLAQQRVHALAQQVVEIDRTTEQLHVTQLQEDRVASLAGIEATGGLELEVRLERVLEVAAGGLHLEERVHLITELVDQLVETEVDLGLNLIEQESTIENRNGTLSDIVVDIQRIQDELNEKQASTQASTQVSE